MSSWIIPSANGGFVYSPRYVPDMSIEPPASVLELINGQKDGEPICCSHCRQPNATLRCSRCQCVKYLSQECQKAHFEFHKEACRQISTQKIIVQNGLARCHEPSGGFFTVAEMMKTGDLILSTGYKESNTVVNGRLYYQEALKYYLMPMVVYKNNYHHACSNVEDQVLLLIVALGGDDKAIRSWCSEESSISGANPNPHEPNRILVDKSPRFDHYEGLTDEQKESQDIMELGVKFRGLAKNDTLFQIIYLFNQMKALSEYRDENNKRLAALKGLNASVDEVSYQPYWLPPYLAVHNVEKGEECIVEEIRSTIRAIEHYGKGNYLIHLRDTQPFSEDQAPRLFKSNAGYGTGTPQTGKKFLWMILQDLFFETPGVKSILNEFVTGELQ